jgi:hypothetical protein
MAKITLRKALRIKKQLEAALKTPVQIPVVSIDIDDKRPIHDLVLIENEKLVDSLAKLEKLSAALMEVREKVEANNAKGVNAIMSKIGHLDRMIALYKPFQTAKAGDVTLAETKRLRKREATKSEHYYPGDDTISVIGVTSQTVEENKAKLLKLRKDREALEEQRLALNNKDELSIEIGDDVIEFLTEFGII